MPNSTTPHGAPLDGDVTSSQGELLGVLGAEAELTFDGVGDRSEAERSLAQEGDPSLYLARIVRVDRGMPLALSARGLERVQPSRKLIGRASTDPMARAAIGDWVGLTHPDAHEMPIIETILPRHGAFSRRDPAEDGGIQVVIANVDVVFVVHALSDRGVNPARLERELVLAFESGASPVIVLTKADLVDEEVVAHRVAEVERVSAGAPIVVESAVTMRGVDEVRAFVPAGLTAAMIGPSGVGKSTLANRLLGSEVQETGEVRAGDGKGRHTTVARELVPVPGGGVLIDTPGMRGIALWRADVGIELAFPEIVAATANCRFRDCRHVAEPGCGVLGAVERGEVDRRRFDRYQSLIAELADLDRAEEDRRRRRKK